MSQAFYDCVKAGGRIKTKQLKNNRFINICYDKGGKAHSSEIKKNKELLTTEASKPEIKVEEKQEKVIKGLSELKEYFNSTYHT